MSMPMIETYCLVGEVEDLAVEEGCLALLHSDHRFRVSEIGTRHKFVWGGKNLIINEMKCLRAEAVQGIFVLTWKLVSFWALPVNWIEAKTQICLPAKLLLRASQYFRSDFLNVENIGYRILFDPSACRRRAALPSGFSSLGWVSNVSHRFWKLIEILIKSFWILGRAECIMYCRIFLLFICRPRKGEVIILERALFLLDL